MTAHITNTFSEQASALKSTLQSFDDAGELKTAIMDIYPRVKKLLRQAHPVLKIDMSQMPSNSGSPLRLNITQTEIHDGELLFKQTPVFAFNEQAGRSVKDVLSVVLDQIEAAPQRYQDFGSLKFD